MNFINVRLLVSDFAASMRFWRDIMKLHMTYGDEAMGYAYFDTGSGGVELMHREGFAQALGKALPAPVPGSHPAVLVFRVDDVDATYAELVARGATSVAEPQDRPAWQARSAQIADPDGYIVEVYNQLRLPE